MSRARDKAREAARVAPAASSPVPPAASTSSEEPAVEAGSLASPPAVEPAAAPETPDVAPDDDGEASPSSSGALAGAEPPADSSPSPPADAPVVEATPPPPPVPMNQTPAAETETPASASNALSDALAEEGLVHTPSIASSYEGDDDAVEMPELSDPDVLEGLPAGTTERALGMRGREVRLTHVPKEEDLVETPETSDMLATSPESEALIVERLLDRTLHCDDFEGAPVTAVVESENHAAVQLRLPNGRLWPVWRKRITGDTWQHVASDMPPPGEDPAFDATYRAPSKETAPFIPPAGHVRAWVTAQGVTPAKGFTLRGVLKAMWRAAEEGFFPAALVDHPKSHFKRIGQGVDGAPPRAVPPKPVGAPVHLPLPTPEAVEAVKHPGAKAGPEIPAGFVRAQVRAPAGGGSVSAAGRTTAGNHRTIWTHGQIGYFPAHAVRNPRSLLVELAEKPTPPPVLASSSAS